MVDQASSEAAPAAWLQDPLGRHQYRYWDGAAWTEHVADAGQQGVDPLEADGPPFLADLRRRETEVESELAEVQEEIARAARSSNDADLGNMLIASIEERLHGAPAAGPGSPLSRAKKLQEELDSIRSKIAEAEESA